MLTNRQKYTYFLSLDGSTWTEFWPVKGISIEQKRQDDEIFFREFCKGEVTIARNHKGSAGTFVNQTLFDSLAMRFFDRMAIADEITLRVYNNYTGSAVLKWQGYFTATDCKLDLDGGRISFVPQPDDDYRYLMKYYDTEVDITDITGISEHTVTINVASVEEVCYREDIDPDPPCSEDGGEWAYCPPPITYGTDPEIYLQYNLNPVLPYRVFKRQRVNFRPTDDTGWYQGDGDYWYYPSCTQQVAVTEIYGFFYLHELVVGIIDYLRGRYTEIPTYTLKSEFVLNDYSSGTTNYITGLDNMWPYVMISQKSNVRLINPSNLATKAMLSLEKLFNIYKELADCWWYIENDTEIRIEHRRFWLWGKSYSTDSQSVDIDLTDDTYYEQKLQRNLQSYVYPQIGYNAEEWNYMEAGYTAFRQEDNPIDYGYALPERVLLQHDLSYITADIEYIFAEPDKISDDGFVVAYCDPGLNVLSEAPINSLNIRLNGHFCIPNIIDRYHRYDRICLYGEFDGDPIVFLTEKRIRVAKNVVFHINESDVDSIDPYKLKKIKYILPNYVETTQDGEVESAVHNLEDDTVEMVLRFNNDAAISISSETFRIMIDSDDAVTIDGTDTLIHYP